MSFFYLNALAGAGKTRALARHADRLARLDRKVLFAQPSKLLIRQTVKCEIEPLGPVYPVTQIHSGVTDAVVADLDKHFRSTLPGGEIVFVTHAALLRLPYAQNAKDWTLIVDEVPSVDVFEELSLPETHTLLTDFLELIPTGAAYGMLKARESDR